jgi:hydroxymethylglutaryl-CoA reductase
MKGMSKKRSEFSGFYKLPIKRRHEILQKHTGLSRREIKLLGRSSALPHEIADLMIENVIGTTQIPIGIATHFKINHIDRLIPMAIEETSVVAAASYAAKLAQPGDGFRASSDEPIMIGQIQLMGIKNVAKAKRDIIANFSAIKNIVNSRDSMLLKLGGGIKGVEVRDFSTERGNMIVVHLLVDVRDAMGANAVNTYCEIVAPYLEELTGGRSVLKILSNLSLRRMVRASAVWKKDVVGADVIEGILDAYAFAKADHFRAATHNKGIMNAIDSLLIATSNDWRAVEAGAHAYASITGKYMPLTSYEKNKNGDLVGHIELPMAIGLVGGATKIHPVSQIVLKILNVKSAQELAEIAASVGLASNFAALRAMVTDGIRKGHMKLHATNLAHMAGAKGDEISIVARQMVADDTVAFSKAKEILQAYRHRIRDQQIDKLVKNVRKKIHKK